jgi:hypothetical protein
MVSVAGEGDYRPPGVHVPNTNGICECRTGEETAVVAEVEIDVPRR